MTLLLPIGSLIALVGVSFAVEALLRRPEALDVRIQTATIDGNAIRYIKTGSGPTSSSTRSTYSNSLHRSYPAH
jgi:hypothetical protein